MSLHVCIVVTTSQGGEQLYDAALGTYDLSVAYLVGQHAQMDPGEFVPDLRRLQDMSEPLRKADIDRRLGRHARCVEHLLEGEGRGRAGSGLWGGGSLRMGRFRRNAVTRFFDSNQSLPCETPKR